LLTNHRLLEIRNLRKYYPVTVGLLAHHIGDVKAVDGVSLDIHEGETLGLVGESGCGKSTLGRTVLRLEEPTSGEVLFQGQEITRLDRKSLKGVRRRAQMVFQDPQSSLDPRMRVGDSIVEAMLIHDLGEERERWRRAEELLERVGLETEHAQRYPHEFSGGQKQRIGIARALAVNPQLIVADEPVSALDVSVQAQILNLLIDLRDEFKLSYLFIAHDLAVIRHISHRVAVMYLGKIAEMAPRDEVFTSPLHPYTEALLSAIPLPNPHIKRERILLPGEVPSPMNPPSGCRFHTRCLKVFEVCPRVEPPLIEKTTGHWVACHLHYKVI
jgi:oligopeptide/dipeptide ABC transporter ATP-binding protein